MKCLAFIPDQKEGGDYPNIGALQITEDTSKYIENVFGLLTLNWSYALNPEDIALYRKYIHKNYSDDLLHLFDASVTMGQKSRIHVRNRVRKAAEILLKGRI